MRAVPILILLVAFAPCSVGQTTDDREPDAVTPRTVDGIPVPPFGYVLSETPFYRYEGYWESNLIRWPATRGGESDRSPLSQARYAGGPYNNAAGKRWVDRINARYREGTSAGLEQDAFRSFDGGHSSLRPLAFPQLRFEEPITSLGNPGRDIFRPRITFGAQSYGANGTSVIEARMRGALQQFYELDGEMPRFQQAFRIFYENNFVYAAPAAGSFGDLGDAFTCLSPFYLHAVGKSGSDVRLLKPLVFASAALPPDLKTRMLRNGLLVPTLMNLFKSTIHGDPLTPESHVPAYTLPAEADDDHEGPAPFLDALLTAAQNLDHIPPVCRIRVEDVEVTGPEQDAAYFEDNTYALSGALQEGQVLNVAIDLRYSWTDNHRSIEDYLVASLHGEARIDRLNDEGSRIRLQIPWRKTDNKTDLRTDVLLLIHDGTYYSSPAYISIRHR